MKRGRYEHELEGLDDAGPFEDGFDPDYLTLCS